MLETIGNPERKKRLEKLRKKIPLHIRLIREELMRRMLAIRKVITPVYPGQYPYSALVDELHLLGEKATHALIELRTTLERFEVSAIPIEKDKVKSLLDFIKNLRKDLLRLREIAGREAKREEERARRAEAEGKPAIAEEAKRSAGAYFSLVPIADTLLNLIKEGLEGMRDSIEAIGLSLE